MITSKAILNINTQDTFVVFRSFEPIHRHSQSIYLRIDQLLTWLIDGESSSYMEHDLHSSLRFIRGKESLHVELTSIRENDGDLRGFILRFRLDPAQLAWILSTRYEDHRLLITTWEPSTHARMIIHPETHRYIRDEILPDKKLRRAFVKAISRNFVYGRESTVHLWPDYDGLFFREEKGICGGLIICKTQVMGFPAVTFSMHT